MLKLAWIIISEIVVSYQCHLVKLTANAISLEIFESGKKRWNCMISEESTNRFDDSLTVGLKVPWHLWARNLSVLEISKLIVWESWDSLQWKVSRMGGSARSRNNTLLCLMAVYGIHGVLFHVLSSPPVLFTSVIVEPACLRTIIIKSRTISDTNFYNQSFPAVNKTKNNVSAHLGAHLSVTYHTNIIGKNADALIRNKTDSSLNEVIYSTRLKFMIHSNFVINFQTGKIKWIK